MSDIDSMFDGMTSAAASSSGVYFTAGNFKVELKEVDYKPNGYKGRSVTFHYKILETSDPQKHPVGSTRVWICKLDKKRDEQIRTLADIKNMIFALSGRSAKEVGSFEVNPAEHTQATNLFKAAIDSTFAKTSGIDKDLLIGAVAALECQNIKTKAGSDFTKHVWSPVDEK